MLRSKMRLTRSEGSTCLGRPFRGHSGDKTDILQDMHSPTVSLPVLLASRLVRRPCVSLRSMRQRPMMVVVMVNFPKRRANPLKYSRCA